MVYSGIGYIGFFIIFVLFENDYNVVIVDNFYNLFKVVVDCIELICGKWFLFYEVDVINEIVFDEVFVKYLEIDSVIYFVVFKVSFGLVVWYVFIYRCVFFLLV